MLSVISDIAALEQIKEEWGELWRSCPDATPFQSPAWVLAWLHHLFKGGEVRAITIRQRGKLIALLPLFLWGDRLQHLTLMGTGVTDYNDVLVAPGTEIPDLSGLKDSWEEATFEELRSCSSLRAFGAKGSENACSICPVIQLPASTEELICRLEPKFRTDLRRASNKLARKNIEISRSSDMEDLFRLHRARWNEKQEEGMLAGNSLENFHREVAAAFDALGILRLYRLSIEGKCAAVLYAFQHRNRCYGYLSGFDPEFGKLSPSNVLLAHAIEQAIKEDADEFDFLRGSEPYKYAWTARDCPNYRVVITR